MCQQISIFEIVVGDVICLKIGDQVPADGILVEGHSLQVDESSMTGESDHIQINLGQNPFLFSGTKVVDGYGMMLVTSVDMNTTWGEMMSEISSDPNEHTPLRERLDKLTSSIDKVGWLVALLVLVVQLVKYFIGTTKDENGNKEFNGSKTSSVDVINAVVGSVANAVIIVVVTIPEGLPLAVTLTLAYLMKRMMDDKAIVRKLSACETMGSATTICTDKTGTLTLNKMIVTKFFLGKGHIKEGSHTSISAEVLELFHQGVGLNTTGVGLNSFILLGFVGLKDPCRPGMKKAVEDCQNAGVNIKMITGDNVFTAKAIATECGILHPNQEVDEGAVIEGEEFRNLTDEERMERIEKMRVMARSSPFDKLLMVQCLRKKGHVVVVTGDGTNDAPALKEADIGLSMGIQGTEVAKESSDIVILDANFASVAILKWGRCFYINIQKSIQFQLTENVAALMINFVAAVSSGEVPLTAVQLLWVNLIMDTLGALALATEKPTEELMKKKPVGRTAPLITNVMWRNLMAQALYQIAVLLTLQFKGELIFGFNKRVNETLFFNTFVLCHVFNEFNARSMEKKNVFEGIQKNKLFM
ncbi:hypothetical protein MTR67_041203 [Solanum verrucosum]|uniref:P-type Ca(2+) transporter n=1 Tax=Solanum verrucosum TaxID=315347 RepID=A0AAF0ULW1_SOLVR|nr:hypothetical protein MTR67_041203 [Solanum verrucosum]